MRGATIDAQARAGCVCGQEVWLASQTGGIAVHHAGSRALVAEVPLAAGDPTATTATQVRAIAAVEDEIWAATVDGELVCLDSRTRKLLTTLRVVGSEKKAPLPALSFVSKSAGGTGLLAVASATGRVLLVDPRSRQVAVSLATFAPCTAVAQCHHSMIVAGDEEGALYLWDLSTAGPGAEGDGTAGIRPTLLGRGSRSRVRHILFEPDTEALWVARESGDIDLYAISPGQGFTLERRVAAVGLSTAMLAVSGKVVVSTSDKKMVSVSADTAVILSVRADAHKSLIHAMVKVARMETAQVWSLGNDEAVREWEVDGFSRPAERPTRLPPSAHSVLALSPFAALVSENCSLGVAREEQRSRSVDLAEDLRRAREEAQEMRLRVTRLEEASVVVAAELAGKVARIKDLEADGARLTKDVLDVTSKVASVERERVMLQTELGGARDEVSRARTDASNRSLEKSRADEELARQKTAGLHLQERLRDAEGRLASAQAENARLCQSIGSVATAQNAERAVQGRLLESNAAAACDLQEAQQLNRMLSSVIASMEYTIRRKEEEDRDVVCLLNAYRRKVADHVTDPFLSALLIATMVRHPARFDLECDETTKSLLLDRNGPFIQFVHSLRQTDLDAYEKLVAFLQKCTSAAGDSGVSAESRQLLDKFVALAAQEGALGADAILAFKRSIPATVSAASPTGGVTAMGTLASAMQPGGGGATGLDAGSPTAATLAGGVPLGATVPSAALPGAAAAYPPPAPQTAGTFATRAAGSAAAEEEFVGASLLRELRGQRASEGAYVRDQRAMFEFILKTRRALVECLVLLQRRSMSAQQVVEALSANAGAGAGTPTASAASVAAEPASPSKFGRLMPLPAIFLGIIRDLVALSSNIVSQYLTNPEKQRLNVR